MLPGAMKFGSGSIKSFFDSEDSLEGVDSGFRGDWYARNRIIIKHMKTCLRYANTLNVRESCLDGIECSNPAKNELNPKTREYDDLYQV